MPTTQSHRSKQIHTYLRSWFPSVGHIHPVTTINILNGSANYIHWLSVCTSPHYTIPPFPFLRPASTLSRSARYSQKWWWIARHTHTEFHFKKFASRSNSNELSTIAMELYGLKAPSNAAKAPYNRVPARLSASYRIPKWVVSLGSNTTRAWLGNCRQPSRSLSEWRSEGGGNTQHQTIAICIQAYPDRDYYIL